MLTWLGNIILTGFVTLFTCPIFPSHYNGPDEQKPESDLGSNAGLQRFRDRVDNELGLLP